MARYLIPFSVLVATLITGCGDSVAPLPELEPMEEISSALSTCSTTCADGSLLSCQGTTCSTSNGSYVRCDGVSQYCSTMCSSRDNCGSLANTRCSTNGAQRDCCLPGGGGGVCSCLSGIWSCEIL